MRSSLFVVVFSIIQITLVKSQFVCFSDSTTIYEFPGTALPVMTGAATFRSGHFKVVVGGKFMDAQAPDSIGVYNCDMLIVDEQAGKTYVLPLSYFPPFVADQFSGFQYGYTMDHDTAYVMGGYGYDLARGYEITFPFLTVFPIKVLIDSVVQHKDYSSLFTVIHDDRLAVMGGTLLHIGQYFLVYGGRETTSIRDEFTDCATVSEWNFEGQLRKFKLKNTNGYPELDEFQVCNTTAVFQQCMPNKWGAEPGKMLEIEKKER
ncbi:MAG: hypothetical protein LH618_14660 [Saprospiraceae bacterium]|nr:hypothetical protein [Saprospiraceae bacterium]